MKFIRNNFVILFLISCKETKNLESNRYEINENKIKYTSDNYLLFLIKNKDEEKFVNFLKKLNKKEPNYNFSKVIIEAIETLEPNDILIKIIKHISNNTEYFANKNDFDEINLLFTKYYENKSSIYKKIIDFIFKLKNNLNLNKCKVFNLTIPLELADKNNDIYMKKLLLNINDEQNSTIQGYSQRDDNFIRGSIDSNLLHNNEKSLNICDNNGIHKAEKIKFDNNIDEYILPELGDKKFKIESKNLKMIIEKYLFSKLNNSSTKDIFKYMSLWMEKLGESLVDMEDPWINPDFFKNSLEKFLNENKSKKKYRILEWFQKNFSIDEFESIVKKCFEDKKI